MAQAQAKMIAIAALIGLTGCQHVTQQNNVTPPPVPGIQPDASANVARAQRALAAGRLGAARDGFSEALRSNPNDVIAGLGLAETYMALNDVTTAQRVFEATGRYARGRYSGRVYQGLGLIALQQEKLGEARRRLRAAVDADGALWRAWIGLGRLNTRAGERAAARVAFAQAEVNAPVLGRVMNDIGMSYLMERQPKQAIQYLERALLADPRLHMARGNLRIARAMAGDYDLAIAGAPVEELPDALNNVGYIAVVNGDFAVADQYLRRAMEISPTYHEAAAANLNLLAHAQTSGERPSVAQRIASASKPVAETDIRNPPSGSAAVPTRAIENTDKVARAATQSGPIPELTNDVGFQWAKRPAKPNHETEAKIVAERKPLLASTAAPSNLVASDTLDAEEFTGVTNAPPADGHSAGAMQEIKSLDQPISDTDDQEAFRWAVESEPVQPQPAHLAVQGEVNKRDDGFLWAN